MTQIIQDASACVWRRLFGGWEVGEVCVCVCVCGGGGCGGVSETGVSETVSETGVSETGVRARVLHDAPYHRRALTFKHCH